jgi:hypothetical protein
VPSAVPTRPTAAADRKGPHAVAGETHGVQDRDTAALDAHQHGEAAMTFIAAKQSSGEMMNIIT